MWKGGTTDTSSSPIECNAYHLFPPSLWNPSFFPPTRLSFTNPFLPPVIVFFLFFSSSFPPSLLLLLSTAFSSFSNAFSNSPSTLHSTGYLFPPFDFLWLFSLLGCSRYPSLPPTGEGVSSSCNASRSVGYHLIPEISLLFGGWKLEGIVSPFVSSSPSFSFFLLLGTLFLHRLLSSQGILSSFSFL